MSAAEKIDNRYLNRWVKDRVCEQGMDYLKELADVLLPGGCGKTQLTIIAQNYPHDIKSCFTEFFTEWAEREVEATWQKLIDALKDTNKCALASDIESSLLVPCLLIPPLAEEVQVVEQQILDTGLELDELMGADSQSDNEGIAM